MDFQSIVVDYSVAPATICLSGHSKNGMLRNPSRSKNFFVIIRDPTVFGFLAFPWPEMMEMSSHKALGTILIALSAVLALSGCPIQPIKRQEPTGSIAGEGAGGAASSLPGGQGKKYRAADPDDPSSPLAQRTIYFEYDSSDIQPRFIAVLRAHASYLAADSAASVTLDGHADERGTREYNLALGDQRASAVRGFLLAEGVPNRRLRTMSYGEERPLDPNHDESAWALNRRVELVY